MADFVDELTQSMSPARKLSLLAGILVALGFLFDGIAYAMDRFFAVELVWLIYLGAPIFLVGMIVFLAASFVGIMRPK